VINRAATDQQFLIDVRTSGVFCPLSRNPKKSEAISGRAQSLF